MRASSFARLGVRQPAPGVAVVAGVQLDARRAELASTPRPPRLDGSMNRLTAMPSRPAPRSPSPRWPAAPLTSSPPSVVRSSRFSGTSVHDVGLHLARDLDHLVGGRHLQVEDAAHRLAQQAHVAILDVAAVLAQVHGDAVGAGELDERRRPQRIGIRRAARLAQRRHVVDVDVETDHQRLSSRCSVLAISSAWARIPASSVPSIITRALVSVPE